MTSHRGRPDPVPTSWEPYGEGISLTLGPSTYALPMITVRELRDDMEEANMLARGYAKIETVAADVNYRDTVVIGGTAFMCRDVLINGDGKFILQFDDDYIELILPDDKPLVVWRPIE